MPRVYRIILSYYNSYHDFKIEMDGRLYEMKGGQWIQVEGEPIDPDKPFILFFERVFTHYMRKLTFNDIVTADEYDLEVEMYESDANLMSIHRIDWERPIPPRTDFHIYRWLDGEEFYGGFDEDFVKRFIGEHGIVFDLI